MRFIIPASLLGCLTALLLGGCDVSKPTSNAPVTIASDSNSKPQENAAAPTSVKSNEIQVMIDFGDDAMLTIKLKDITQAISVEEVMQRVAKHPRSPKIELSGSGLTGFVAAIGEQNTARGYGWLYEVNGKRAERGIGQTEVQPGDRILWVYEKW